MRQAILGSELEGYYNRQIQNEMDGKGMEQKERKEEKKKKKKKKEKKKEKKRKMEQNARNFSILWIKLKAHFVL